VSSSALVSRTANAAAPRNREETSPYSLEAAAGLAIRARWLHWLEWIAVGLVALAALALHIRFVTHIGGLWRDETNSINLATLPTLSEAWHFLDYDSFPVLYFIVLRSWTGIFGAANDEALRVLGLLIGLSILAALWANARAFGSRLPLLSLALVGLNPMIIRYGDSNRAYGLGIFLILLTLRSFWRLVERPAVPSAKEIVSAAVLAVLSVHCLYYNAVLLLAIAAGAVYGAVRSRLWRTAGIIVAIGVLAAASLLPYTPIILRMREWTFLVSYPATFSWLWKRAGEVIGSPEPGAIWLWVGLVLTGLGLGLVANIPALRQRLGVRDGSQAQPSSERFSMAVLFATISLMVGVLGYAAFLRMLNYYTQPWYYITLAAFAACTLDAIFGAWPTTDLRNSPAIALRCLRPLVAISLLCWTVPQTWYELPTRHTNVDLVAARIQMLSRKGDVVLIPRWECAITFCRYYHGKAEVITIPPISDHRFHRYDLVLSQMKTANAYQPVLDQMERSLRSGHRAFLADVLPFPNADVRIPAARPLYQDLNGTWHGDSYETLWKAQAGRFLRAHTTHAWRIDVSLPSGSGVQQFEQLYPGLVEGWR
jgi:4-amino-4-deoxy-L-arabinose transferase-like glycosyltransferase